MKKILISFGDEKYKKSLDLLGETSLEIGGVDFFSGYSPEEIKKIDNGNFWLKNQYILSFPRGPGFWIWKTAIILDTFSKIEDGDIVLYSDAGLSVIHNLDPLYNVALSAPNDGIMLFKLPPVGVVSHKLMTWTKRDAFILTGCDNANYWHADMVNGALSLWVKNQKTTEFLKEWARYMRDPRISTDDINMCGQSNFMGFKGHRHDQSVLSILAKKYDIELFRDPTQYGNEFMWYPNSPYGQLFHHHRNFKH